MGGACSTCEGAYICIYAGFWWGKLRERDHLGDPGLDGRIILKCIFRMWDGGMEWLDVAQDRDGWGLLWMR
jgi:hypothetical protein